MRDSAAAFEIPLTGGEDLGGLRYSFALARTERVAPGTMAALRSPRDDQRVAIERVADDRITLRAEHAVDTDGPCALVVAPWFLYDRLVQALDAITTAPLALTL